MAPKLTNIWAIFVIKFVTNLVPLCAAAHNNAESKAKNGSFREAIRIKSGQIYFYSIK